MVIEMERIIGFYNDLQENYSTADLQLIANYLNLPADNPNDLRWIIAIYHSIDTAEMPSAPLDILSVKSTFKFTPELRYIPSSSLSILTQPVNYRRLKFLGRTVFDLVVADYLYRQFQQMDVQYLSNLLLQIRSNNYINDKLKCSDNNCVDTLMIIIAALYLHFKSMRLNFIKPLQDWLLGELQLVNEYSQPPPLPFETSDYSGIDPIIKQLKTELKFTPLFNDTPDGLLRAAITPQRSGITPGEPEPENQFPQNYERLEWLGDRVLELVISDWIYTHKPTFINKKSNIVNNQNLIKIIGDSCSLMQTKNRVHPKMCADMFEAIIGAVYLNLYGKGVPIISTLHIWLIVMLDITAFSI